MANSLAVARLPKFRIDTCQPEGETCRRESPTEQRVSNPPLPPEAGPPRSYRLPELAVDPGRRLPVGRPLSAEMPLCGALHWLDSTARLLARQVRRPRARPD